MSDHAKRALWFVVGAGAGVAVTARAKRLVEGWGPEGLRDKAEALTLGARIFAAEARAGHDEARAELAEKFGVDAGPSTQQLAVVEPRTPAGMEEDS